MTKTVYAYNKYFYEFLKEIKHSCKEKHPDLYKDLKTRYTVKDNATVTHIESFINSCTSEMLQIIVGDSSDMEKLSELVVLDTNVLGELSDSCNIKNLQTYVLLFAYLGIVYKNHAENEEELLNTLGECQNDNGDNIENIIDDDLSGILKQIKCLSNENAIPSTDNKPSNFEETLANSSIGSLAREIAEDINIEGMNINSPEDLFKGENSKVIGDIVSKVTSNLQAKMKNGSLNQEQIMAEAMSLMGSMGNNEMLKNMMSAMGAMGGMPGMSGMSGMPGMAGMSGMSSAHSSSRARDRLSKKYAEKKK
jgi:hypothetical protein